MREIEISAATSNDVPELVGLMEAFYAESSFLLDRQWAANSFRHLLSVPSLGSVWLARVGSVSVGHVVLSVRYTMEHAAMGGYVDDLYVVPEFRRQQVASRLLHALVADCERRGCVSLYVEIGASNIAAIATYRRFGLAPVSDGRLLLNGPLRAEDT